MEPQVPQSASSGETLLHTILVLFPFPRFLKKKKKKNFISASLNTAIMITVDLVKPHMGGAADVQLLSS